MKRFFLAFVAIFLIVLSALLYDVSSASAQSLPQFNLTSTLNVQTGACDSVDVTLNWSEYFMTDLADYSNVTQGIRDSFSQALETGVWGVVQHQTGDRLAVSVYWREDNVVVPRIDYDSSTQRFNFVDPSTGFLLPYHQIEIFMYGPTSFAPCKIATSYGGSNLALTLSSPEASLFFYTGDYTLAPGLEGHVPELPDTYVPPEQVTLTPEYQYSVNSNGLLSVTYLKNITPFLSGTNFFVLNRTTENWETLGAEIFSESFTPAGWTDKTFEQLLDPGYYVLRISHSQTFDSNSPWRDKDVWVDDVYIQFFWDGQTTFSGTTTGCEGQVCNIFQTDESEKMWNMFEKLGLGDDEFGLGAAVTAPLTFLASLPSKAANCTPITLTLPYVNREISLPCMTSIYQTHFGLIFSLFQTIMLGLFGYYAAVKVYGNIKQMKDPEDDRIEVVKL